MKKYVEKIFSWWTVGFIFGLLPFLWFLSNSIWFVLFLLAGLTCTGVLSEGEENDTYRDRQ